MTQESGDKPESTSTAPELSPGLFDKRVGTCFRVEAGGGIHELRLIGVEALADSPREDGGFRLEFAGPPQPILPQAIYGFAIDGDRHGIFIVPLGPAPDGGMRYEAVFY